MFKRALVSCSDKTGLVDFLRAFPGLEIVSTGGTYRYLEENGFKVTPVSDVTEFPEILGGRVKTLHPKIFGGVLANSSDSGHQVALKDQGIKTFDLVVVNLYPFQEQVRNNSPWGVLIENIDIGGPSLLRAAAKNYQNVAVFCDPKDYSRGLTEKTPELKLELALKVFEHVSQYDKAIAQAFQRKLQKTKAAENLHLIPHQDLRYGENPHQKSTWFKFENVPGLHDCKVLQGKPLSYNNLLDVEAVLATLQAFNSEATAVAVKHTNPCGVAGGATSTQAVEKLLKTDPKSIFGGVVGFNFDVTKEIAVQLSPIFLEIVFAPSFSKDALEVFKAKKNLRLMEGSFQSWKSEVAWRSLPGGMLFQTQDQTWSLPENWSSSYRHLFTPELIQDVLFGERVVSQLKSNAIALVKDSQTVGLGMGQVNRVDAVKQALERWQSFHPETKSPVLLSDAFFPFPDIIELVARAGIEWMIHPGGSIQDAQVEAAARNHGVKIIYNHMRHFKH